MRSNPPRSLRRTRSAFVSLALCLGLLTACGNDNNTTIVNGLDCGLIRADLNGNWRVQFATANRSLANCGNPGANGTPVDISGSAVTFTSVSVFGSDESASFQVLGDRADAGADPNVDDELIAGVEADSCLTLFQVWDSDDSLYVECVGTLGLNGTNPSISTVCDSAEVDVGADGTIDYTCDLSSSVSVDVDIL